jgi:hypothetical protein
VWGLSVPIGIDISQDAIRIYTDDKSFKHYGVIGITPQWNEPIVWTNSKAVRSSQPSIGISFSDIFHLFRINQRATYRYQDLSSGEDIELPTTELITDALIQHIPRYSEGFSVLCVDNTLSEFHQTELLKTIGQKGFGKRELLWRPIALCLDHLSSSASPEYVEKDKMLIVDFDSQIPELTELEMREHREALMPVRSLPENLFKEYQIPGQGFSTGLLLDELISEISGADPNIGDQLHSGPFAREFMHFLNHGESTEIWIRKDLDHEKLILKKPILDSLRNKRVGETSFDDVRQGIEQIVEERGIKTVLWHGLLPRIQTSLESQGNYVLSEEASSRGAQEYGRRILAGEPTYLDTLPGLEILSLEKKTGSYKFFTVIPAGECEGGKTVRIPETITKFSLKEKIPDFTAVLRNIAEDSFKESITSLPEIEYEGNVPLLLSAEMRPAQGHAVVTIEGREGYEDVFGRQRKIELDWDRMIDIPNPIEEVYDYTGPEYYPVRGRIADDSDSLSIAREFATGKYHVGSQFDYPCGQVGYLRIHEPWGYKNPCGHIIREPQRALFGAKKEKDPEVKRLAKAIGKIINSSVKRLGDRHRNLNYMFRYAPEEFREELRNLFKQKKPTLDVNSVYAVGRTFYKKEDFEIFLDFFLMISKNIGYPEYPLDRFTPAYFWSFFRALCYYKKTSLVDRTKVEDVLACICNYAGHCSTNGWPGGRRSNVIKYLLFGILFSIRLREHNHDFLSIDSSLFKDVIKVIKKQTPQIPFPPAMMAYQLPGTLNDYVLRFVKDIQTKKDIKALEGLVVE